MLKTVLLFALSTVAFAQYTPPNSGSGTGTVTSIVCNSGLTGATITTSGTCATDKTVTAQKFFGTAAPGSVAGNLPGDFFTDTTNHNEYTCGAPSGTAAPACTSVTAGGWLLVNGGGVTGSGTTGYFSKWTGASTLANSVCDEAQTTALTVTCTLGMAAPSWTGTGSDPYIHLPSNAGHVAAAGNFWNNAGSLKFSSDTVCLQTAANCTGAAAWATPTYPYGSLGGGTVTFSSSNNLVSFYPLSAGTISAVTFWKTSADTGSHMAIGVYDSTCTLITNGNSLTLTAGGANTLPTFTFSVNPTLNGYGWLGFTSDNAGGSTVAFSGNLDSGNGNSSNLANAAQTTVFTGNSSTGTTTITMPPTCGSKMAITLGGNPTYPALFMWH